MTRLLLAAVGPEPIRTRARCLALELAGSAVVCAVAWILGRKVYRNDT